MVRCLLLIGQRSGLWLLSVEMVHWSMVMQECGKGTVTWQLIEGDIDSPESCTICGCSMLIDLLFYGCGVGRLHDGRNFFMMYVTWW
jgi:hypothetical protein